MAFWLYSLAFRISPATFQFSPTVFQFSSMAFHFSRNPRKSIYGKKCTKDRYSSFIFFATHSPSFVIPAKQYLRLTHHTPVVHLCSQQCACWKKRYQLSKVLLTLTGTLMSLLKHTTEDPAPGCLSRTHIVKMIYFKLWVLYFDIRNPCAPRRPRWLNFECEIN